MLHIGLLVRDWILHLAQLLVTDEAPGLVVLIFGILLLGLVAWTITRAISHIRAVRGLTAEVNIFKDGVEFSAGFDRFNAGIQNWSRDSSARQTVVVAWEEYAETTVIDSRDGQDLRRNSVRPSNFLNLEDLGFGPGFFRIWPGLFVSLGLFCTFLGLVAALNGLGTDLNNGSKPEDVVIKLMTIASAKFVMSLAGLACSIIFSVVLRVSQGNLDKALHRLCNAIERRLSFVSLEDLGFRQLKAVEEQREAYRKIGMEFVEQLQRPLKELPGKLSESISSSIATEMKPIFDKVSQMGISGMETMVGDLSNQITSKVGLALEKTSTALTEAAEQISRMVERMNTSSNQMGQGMETALGQMASAIADLRGQVAATGEVASTTMTEGADKLLGVMNDTLQGIRDNTAAGAEAMKAAAAEMRMAAEGFGKELAAATANGVTAVSQRIGAVSDAADQAITKQISRMVDRMNTSNSQMGQGMETALGQMASAIADLRGQVTATGEIASSTMTEGADKLLGVMNDTLQGIRDNTAAGAEAMKAAAAEMRMAAEGFSKELAAATANGVTAVSQRIGAASDAANQAITSAGQEMVAAFGKTSAEIAKVGADMSTTLGSEVVGQLSALGKQLEDLVGAVNEGVGGMRNASTSLKSGADTIAAASVSFGGASRELVSATDPVRLAHERIEASIRDLLRSTEVTANGSKSMVESATQVLEAARSALGNEREGIRQTLDATRATLSELSDEAEKLNKIDQLLGRALTEYAQQLNEALGTAQSHIRKMQDTLAPGIDTLQAVVARAEAFMPSPPGRWS